MDEFAVELEEKQLRKIRHFGVNLYGLLRAKVHPCGQRTGDLSDRRTAAGL